MKGIDNYQNTKCELDLIEKRLNLISQYEKILVEEKNRLNELEVFHKKIITKMEEDLLDLSGVENKLYCEIVLKGINVTKAIDKIAYEEDLDVSTLWKNYYPKIKRKINDLNLVKETKNFDRENISM